MSENDYYDVLGVRPSAGRDEIELAYKGRRSQYHPDRYGQSDGETQAWATRKMQDVNEAYAALKDQGKRGRNDGGCNSKSASPEPSPRPAPSRAQAVTLEQVLRKWSLAGEPFEKIFIAPNIPMKKLSGAIESYGEGIRAKDVVALIDDTVFGGAKEGILITETEVRFKAIFEPIQSWQIERIEEIASEGNRVFVNGLERAKLNVPDKKTVRAFFALFDTYLKRRWTDESGQRDDPEQQTERPTSSAGERLFAGLPHGFYAGMERPLQREIEAAETKEEWLSLVLASGLLPVSMSLHTLTRSEGIGLSETQRSYLSSDVLRFELLTYAMAVTGHLLFTEAGLNDEQSEKLVLPVAMRMLLAYIVEIEGVAKKRTLRSIANPRAELQESQFFLEFSRRWRRYGLLLKGASGNLEKEFAESLKTPAAFLKHEIRQMLQLNEFAEGVVDRVLPTRSIKALLQEISEGVEAALVSALEQA